MFSSVRFGGRSRSLLLLNASQIPTLPSRGLSHTALRYKIRESTLPRIAQPNVWHMFVPKFLRPGTRTSKARTGDSQNSKDWNPWTIFIILFILIGSQSLHLIRLRQDFEAFSRRADSRISLLKEVIGRVQRGEQVDIERMLGTGKPNEEKEWEDVLRELEQEDKLWSAKAKERRTEGIAKGEKEDHKFQATDDEFLSEPRTSAVPKGYY